MDAPRERHAPDRAPLGHYDQVVDAPQATPRTTAGDAPAARPTLAARPRMARGRTAGVGRAARHRRRWSRSRCGASSGQRGARVPMARDAPQATPAPPPAMPPPRAPRWPCVHEPCGDARPMRRAAKSPAVVRGSLGSWTHAGAFTATITETTAFTVMRKARGGDLWRLLRGADGSPLTLPRPVARAEVVAAVANVPGTYQLIPLSRDGKQRGDFHGGGSGVRAWLRGPPGPSVPSNRAAVACTRRRFGLRRQHHRAHRAGTSMTLVPAVVPPTLPQPSPRTPDPDGPLEASPDAVRHGPIRVRAVGHLTTASCVANQDRRGLIETRTHPQGDSA